MALTKAQKKVYLRRHGNMCPYPHCYSEDLKILGRPASDDNHITQDVQCLSCGNMWTDIYTLSDIEE